MPPEFLSRLFRSREKALALNAEALLSVRGEASGVARARELLAAYAALGADGRLGFLKFLAERFGADPKRIDRAIAAYQANPGPQTALGLHDAAEPRRQELLRRMNLAPGGTAALVRMREHVLGELAAHPELETVDADFAHLFASWFNRGFLRMQRIDWSTPAAILEKVILHEAVHEIDGWDDLRRRLDPADRKCFAFFHPALADEPLIFVEVALTRSVPQAIAPLLAEERSAMEADRATIAVFYSISNCQPGLKGISFGNFLIKQVVEDLKRELPHLKTFVTLSPVPGFMRWLARERELKGLLAELALPAWHLDAQARERLKPAVLAAAGRYFLEAKNAAGKPVDPVARFHLGNGARLDRVNWLGDQSVKGLAEGAGLMVNYVYDLGSIERNHEAFENDGEVVAAGRVKLLLRRDTRAPQQV